jgi:hypothetical protein
MSRDVVCISCTSGAGGEEVGRLVAEQLGFLYIDDEIIGHAAVRGGIDPEQVADEERRRSRIGVLLDHLAKGGGEAWGVVSPALGDDVPSDAVRAFIRDAIVAAAARGKVVIVAHGASHAIGGSGKTLRVFVTAPAETRAKRLGAAEGLDDSGATKAIRKADAGRADYLKRFYEIGEELPTHYDLVVNTNDLSADEAASLIARAATYERAVETR